MGGKVCLIIDWLSGSKVMIHIEGEKSETLSEMALSEGQMMQYLKERVRRGVEGEI